MSLDFSDIIAISQEIINEDEERAIYDVEVSVLYCGWHKVKYQDFIENQEKYTAPYIQFYHSPRKPKSIKSFPSASSRLMKILCNHFGIKKLYQSNFRETMLGLYEQKRLKIDGEIIQEKSLKQTEVKNKKILRKKINNRSNFIFQTEPAKQSLVCRSSDTKKLCNLLENNLIISLYGFPGVGKTFFIHQFCTQIQDEYNYYYTDLRYINSFEDWIIDILSQADLDSEEYKSKAFQTFLELLENRSSIIVLDSIGILEEKFIAFLESLLLKGKVYKSKIVLLSHNRVNLNTPKDKIGYHLISGITAENDINRLFASLGLNDRQHWKKLCDKHQGNIRELIYVAKFIKDFFQGNVSQYLNLNSFFISPELISVFSSINFTNIDISIFSMFKNEKNLISENVFRELRVNSKASEIFSRVELLCEKGYLIKEELENGVVSYTIMPLLRSFLIQKGRLND